MRLGACAAHAGSASVRAVADEISLGPWTISAKRDDEGVLEVEVRLEGETRAKFVLPPEDAPGSAGRPKRDQDMDF